MPKTFRKFVIIMLAIASPFMLSACIVGLNNGQPKPVKSVTFDDVDNVPDSCKQVKKLEDINEG